MKSFFKPVLLLMIVISLSACSSFNWYFKDSVDKPTGTITLEGVKSPVTISRDDLGIPFIEAQNEDDMFFINELDERSMRSLQNYARGVTAYIKTHPDLPAEFRLTGFKPTEWTPENSLLEYAGKVGWEKDPWLFYSYPTEPVQTGEADKLKSIDIRDLFPDNLRQSDAPAASIIMAIFQHVKK